MNGYMARYDDWRDTAQWPVSSRQTEILRREVSSQEDPLNKEGLVGFFCRAFFPIQTAMETFLPEVYAPTTVENRWDYIPADSTAGVVVYDDRFVYSHHATDPAGGKLLNAFDLVRIHLFGNDETKESFQQMCEFALQQDAVKLTSWIDRHDNFFQMLMIWFYSMRYAHTCIRARVYRKSCKSCYPVIPVGEKE